MQRTRFTSAAFTLVELMIVVALAAIIIALAAPSLRDMIQMQRLRSINAQVVTDIAFARSESVSRGTFVQLHYQTNSSLSCYVIYTRSDVNPSPTCDCTAAAGSRCTAAGLGEVRTVQVAKADGVTVATIPNGGPDTFTFDPRTGGIIVPPFDASGIPPGAFVVQSYLDSAPTARKFRDVVGASGRVSVCAPSGSIVGGEPC